MLEEKLVKRKEIQRLGKFLIQNEFTWGNAGNLSVRHAEDSFLITASGTHLGSLEEDEIITCQLSSDEIQGKAKPSKETQMHREIYLERSDIQAVIHAAPFYSTLISCSDLEIPSTLFVEAMYYLEKIERVEYHHPGSIELAKAVKAKASKSNILLLENHGVLVYDTSVEEAKKALETLEYTARMVVEANKNNIALSQLSQTTVDDFLENSGYKKRRRW